MKHWYGLTLNLIECLVYFVFETDIFLLIFRPENNIYIYKYSINMLKGLDTQKSIQ